MKALDTIRYSASCWTIGMMTESIKNDAAAQAAQADGGTAPAPPAGAPPTPDQPKQ